MTRNFNDTPLPHPDNVCFFDIEANGLSPTEVFCVVTKHKGTVNTFTNASEFKCYAGILGDDVYWCAHNGIGYDWPVLKKLWGYEGPKNILDTLVLSRLATPSRKGGHSLGNLGNLLGFPKGEHYDFSTYTPEMLEYCKQDVDVLEQVYNLLSKELQGFSKDAVFLETQVALIIDQQVKHGWSFNSNEAHTLLAKLKEKLYELEDEVQKRFVPLPIFKKQVTPKYKKDGELSVVGLKFLGDRWTEVGGPLSHIEYPPFNLGSRQQIGRHLQFYGWVPKKFTEHGQPIVDEKVLEDVTDVPEAQLIAEYLMVQKRKAMVDSWLEAVQESTGRIHGRVRSNGAITGRMTHDSPNVAQVPASKKDKKTGALLYGHKAGWGADCRDLWTTPEGYKLVGCDASGLELRMLAHYMDDDDYVKELLTGDIHTANQIAAGLSERSQAKTFIYAFLYGAGDAKIGTIVGGTAKDGRELKERFLRNTPSLKRLRDRVTGASDRGYLKGLDGRKLYIRSPHAALNTLLQGAGAIVMKQGLVILDEFAQKWSLDYHFVGNIHDEWQTEVREAHAEKFGHLAVSCIQAAGLKFNLRCPLDGEFKIGDTWAQTH